MQGTSTASRTVEAGKSRVTEKKIHAVLAASLVNVNKATTEPDGIPVPDGLGHR